MKSAKIFLLLTAILLVISVHSSAQTTSATAPKNSAAKGYLPHRIKLDSKVSETLLIHKEEPACQKDHDGIRVTGTVVFAITIDRSGQARNPVVISGPKLLRPLALATVRKYRYKPYLLKDKSVPVETTVSITMECFFYSGQA